MATILNTISFLIHFFWVVSKPIILLVSTSWLVYLMDFNRDIQILLSTTIFVVNGIMINSMFNMDKYFRENYFYRFYNISNITVLVSKIVLLGTAFFVHFTLYFLFSLRIDLHLYLVLASFFTVGYTFKLFFVKTEDKPMLYGFFFLFCLLNVIIYKALDETTSLLLLIISLFGLSLVGYKKTHIKTV